MHARAISTRGRQGAVHWLCTRAGATQCRAAQLQRLQRRQISQYEFAFLYTLPDCKISRCARADGMQSMPSTDKHEHGRHNQQAGLQMHSRIHVVPFRFPRVSWCSLRLCNTAIDMHTMPGRSELHCVCNHAVGRSFTARQLESSARIHRMA